MADRSPDGRLEVAGGVLRYLHDCNWKMFVENLNDAMHPMVAHESLREPQATMERRRARRAKAHGDRTIHAICERL